MINDDCQMIGTQERILRFELFLAEARKKETPANYQALASGYLAEIDKMRGETRDYLSPAHTPVEAA